VRCLCAYLAENVTPDFALPPCKILLHRVFSKQCYLVRTIMSSSSAAAAVQCRQGLFIGGKFKPSLGSRTLDVIDPATEEVRALHKHMCIRNISKHVSNWCLLSEGIS
jgi:hypothetical protein